MLQYIKYIGFDILGHAETGSGKTAAFILPLVDKILKNFVNFGKSTNNGYRHPIALIIAPTRELVLQLYDQVRKFVEGIHLY